MTAPLPNPLLTAVSVPPIARAGRWIAAYDGSHGPLIDCSQAVPNHAPPAGFATRLAEAAASAAGARYGDILGDRALHEAYAGHVAARYGTPVAAGRVAVTSGCNQAFFAAMLTVARAGDVVVLPAPWYFNHKMTLEMLGIEARPLQTEAADGFLPSVAGLEAVLDPRCRALVLVSPNNPTGAVYPPERLAELLDVCVSRGMYLVLDETYRDFLDPALGKPHELFAQTDARENLVALYSFSKSYAIPGHRVGAMIAGEATIAELEKVIDCIQICAPRPAQAALPWAIEELADWRDANRDEIARRADIFRAAFASLPGWELDQIGAYFAYVRHPFADRPAEAVAEALTRELGVLVLPGSFFGPGQDRHLRIAFANVDADGIREMARRIGLGLSAGAFANEPDRPARNLHG
ncbi:aminotransferase [Aurantimonas sp. DM33-3]|uniref:aminotransferase n=1 Tax=Aurantimonas sp. DM33-3 TaxID=2766955 RepID=UPI001652A1D0|nr:aminotransferase [Aurantimonas sp. DM33-3]